MQFYQLVISPGVHLIVGPGQGCRHTPTCSRFMVSKWESDGIVVGSWLGLKRLAQCHPWGK